MKTRSAFTLIEILVSVLILSVSYVAVLQIHSQNREQVIYITQRNKYVLEDSLFLGRQTLHYHKSTKNAYDLIGQLIKPKKDESRKILKKIERSIYIDDPVQIFSSDRNHKITATVDKISLKHDLPSAYSHLTINAF